MIVHDEDLPAVHELALAARARGQSHVVVEIDTRYPVRRFMALWEGCVGEVVGRSYYEDGDALPWNPEVPKNLVVKAVRVRVHVIDVIEALRRRREREKREVRQLIPANRIARPPGSGTTR